MKIRTKKREKKNRRHKTGRKRLKNYLEEAAKRTQKAPKVDIQIQKKKQINFNLD